VVEIDVFEALASSYGALCATVPEARGVIGEAPGLRYGALGGPLPDINRIMPTRLSPATAEADVSAALDRLVSAPLLSVWIPPDPWPPNIGDWFLSRGFRADRGEGEVPAMVSDLTNLPEVAALPGVRISSVATRDEVDTANRVLADAFGAPPEVGQLFADLTADTVLNRDGPVWTLVALLDDRPVATGLGVVHDDALGIYSVATLPDARGRGLGRAVVRRLMEDGVARGARAAVLESSAMGRSVYEQLGFREAGRYRILIRNLDDEEPDPLP
jgi:ribosomal protein S18 acetylase RimI-like enzyme